MALKHGLFFLLTLSCFVAHGTATRDFLINNPKQDLVDCWSHLIELKSCSNEILHFFTNGQADIGPNCCCAITVITHKCWPAILISLGITAHEAHYLRAYCDAATSSPAPAPAPAADGEETPFPI
ncbi:egg cell-secreted protein 1.4-like [Abrus precatorius]|uniref:Egg cell-secreted protein 1.4-like n=1 Tax=Abrus precatorius TaxID=3816 RepID=A0A8B8KH30_ABRPR|nr:egg cell-secreted protein 1.4-like [Abrus precatorius]